MPDCDFVILGSKYTVLNNEKMPLEPVTMLEKEVLRYIENVMGQGKEASALLEWNVHSIRFLKEEAPFYDPKYVYEARAKYIKYFFDKDLEIWPYH